MNHYVYKITDPVTGEFYIGVRSCSCDIFEDDYMGSMSTWEPQDPGRLVKELLGTFPSRELANKYERRAIKKFFNEELNRNFMIPANGFGNFQRKGDPIKDDVLNIRINSELKESVSNSARSEGLSITDYVSRVLNMYVKSQHISIFIDGNKLTALLEKDST